MGKNFRYRLGFVFVLLLFTGIFQHTLSAFAADTVITMEEDDRYIQYLSVWQTVQTGGHTIKKSAQKDDKAAFEFYGNSFSIYAKKGNDQGIMEVSVDGTLHQVDLWANTSASWELVFSSGTLAETTHFVEIVNPLEHQTINIDYITYSTSNNLPGASVPDPQRVTDNNTPISGKIEANDSDGGTVSYKIVSIKGSNVGIQKQPGGATIDSDGTWTFTPNAAYSGKALMTIEVSDGKNKVDTVVQLFINPVNPVEVTIDEKLISGPFYVDYMWQPEILPNHYGGSAMVGGFDGSQMYFDFKGTSFSIYGKKSPSNGKAGIDVTSWDTEEQSSDEMDANSPTEAYKQLLYSKNDLSAGRHSVTVTNKGESYTTIDFIKYVHKNEPPTAPDYTFTKPKDSLVTGKVEATDPDDEAPFYYTLSKSPAHGNVTMGEMTTGEWAYTPHAGYVGTDSFTILVTDRYNAATISRVNLEFTSNQPPTIPTTYNAVTQVNTGVGGKVTGTDPEGGTVTYSKGTDPGHGTVIVNSDGTWTYTPQTDYSGTDAFTILVSDGNGGTASTTVTVTIVANTVPTDISLSNNQIAENVSSGALIATLTATDPDADEIITFSLVGGDVGSFTIVGNTLYSNTVFDYETKSSYSVTVRATDSKLATFEKSFPIQIMNVNESPVSISSNKNGVKNTNLNFVSSDFSSYFADVDGDSLGKVRIESLPANGELKLDGQAVTVGQVILVSEVTGLSFTPDMNWSGSTSFTWKGHDGTNYSDSAATLTIKIDVVNTLPTVGDSQKSGVKDTNITFIASDFASHFVDVDGDSLNKVRIESLPTNGALKLAGLAVTVGQEILVSELTGLSFTPDTNWNGSTSFTWKGNDGTDYSVSAATLTIEISAVAVNAPPTVSNGQKSGTQGTTITFTASDFTSHFADVDEDILSKIQVESLPTNGVLKLNGLAVTVGQEISASELSGISFTPDTNWSGSTSFTWKGHDGTDYSVGSATQTIEISAVAVNAPPTVSNGQKSGTQGTTISFTVSDFTSHFADVDEDILSKIQVESLPANGVLKLNGLAVTVGQEISASELSGLSFTPNSNWSGSTSFTWKGNDGTDYSVGSATQTIEISAVAVNAPPTVSNGQKSGTQGTTITFTSSDFTSHFADVDEDILSKIQVESLPANGVLKLNGLAVTVGQEIPASDLSSLSFTPDANWSGSTSFTWKGHDNTDYSTATGTFRLIITAVIVHVNHPPVARDASIKGQHGASIRGTLIATDTDGDRITYYVVRQGTKGTVTIDPNSGEFTYLPNAGMSGTDTFAFQVTDGRAYSNVATVVIEKTASTNVNLKALQVSNGSLMPGFTPEQASYKVDVAENISSITVTPTTDDESATVSVNGAIVLRGHSSEPIKLEKEETVIEVVVMAQDGSKKTYTITVKRSNVPVTEIELDKTRLTLREGDEPVFLHALIKPENATDKNLKWKSSKPEVATVDDQGKVVPLSKGTATITVSTPDGKVRDTTTVKVNAGTIKELIPDPVMVVLAPGETESINVMAYFGHETVRKITGNLIWKNENNKVATVKNGVVTAKKSGTTLITASYLGKKTSILVKVYENLWVDERKVELSLKPTNKNDKFELELTGKLLTEKGDQPVIKLQIGKNKYTAKINKEKSSFSIKRTISMKGDLPEEVQLLIQVGTKQQAISLPLSLLDKESIEVIKENEAYKITGLLHNDKTLRKLTAVTEDEKTYPVLIQGSSFEVELPEGTSGTVKLIAEAYNGLVEEWEVKVD